MNQKIRDIIEGIKPTARYIQNRGDYSNQDIHSLIRYIEENDKLALSREVKIQFKNVWGKENIYVISNNVEHICVLTGKATVNYFDLVALKNLGFTITGYGANEEGWLKEKGVIEL